MQKVINTRALYVYDKTMITIVQTKIKTNDQIDPIENTIFLTTSR